MTKPAAPSEAGNCRPASTAEGSFKEFPGCEGIRRQGWFPFRRGRDVVAIHAWASESAEKVNHSELALKHCAWCERSSPMKSWVMQENPAGTMG